MAALATQVDLVARIGALTTEQQARADALLDDATAEVRDFTGQYIERVDNDVMVLTAHGMRIVLPQRPVIDVTAVAAINGDTDVPLTGWAWDGLETIDLRQATADTVLNNFAGTYRVTNSHGLDTIPSGIVGRVCRMVNRVLTSPTLAEGLVGQNIGQYGWQGQQGNGSMGTGVSLNRGDEQYFIKTGWRRSSATVKTHLR